MLNLLPLTITSHLDHSYGEPSPFQVRSNYELPPQARAANRTQQASLISGGITAIISRMLLGCELQQDTQGQVLTIRTGTKMGFSATIQGKVQWGGKTATWEETVLLALACALSTDEFPLIRASFHHFINSLADAGLRYPFSAASLHASTSSQPILLALGKLADTVDAEVREKLKTGFLSSIAKATTTKLDEQLSDVALAERLYPPKAAARQSHKARLTRLIGRGGVALLVGPPGTFKTETAKNAALSAGASLVIAKGAPGVEDRDFLGGVYPTKHGPQWVDGPISRAFVQAVKGPTVLLIDEALRYLPETLNVLIGAMDTVNSAELSALGLGAEAQSGIDRYHVLPLPNGDHLVCPARHLTWVMTTNMGSDHLQTSDRLDGALQSRVDVELYFGTPEKETAVKLYQQVSGHPALAQLTWKAEELSRNIIKNDKRALERPLEARKSIAMMKETLSLMDEGLELKDAFKEAFTHVALPYCCARTDSGQAEYGMAAMLMQQLEHDVLGAL